MKLSFPRFFGKGPSGPPIAGEPPAAPVFDLSPTTEACRYIVGYWQSLRGDRLRPRSAEIDPTALARHLPHIALFEVLSRDLTLCRLAGTAIRLSLGFELTGKNAVHLYAPELHRAAGYRFWTMAHRPCGATFEMQVKFSSGIEAPHELVILPLEPDGPGKPPMLLVGAEGLQAVKWENMAVLPQLQAAPSFRFVDVGAGIPASTLPPDDFTF
ncbi:MAG TPA: PAS domain-containing protein [Alphaproteobacteria bacterium]|jgi:hypothetical protein|nr:PAS domain-containing protein [Alphaproteobacteria bacterium]